MRNLAALALVLGLSGSAQAQYMDSAWQIIWTGNPVIQQAGPPKAPKAREAAPAPRGPASASDPGPLVLALDGERGEALLNAARRKGPVAGAMVVGVQDGSFVPTPDGICRLIDTAMARGVRTFIIESSLDSDGSVEAKLRGLSSRGIKYLIASPQ